MSRKYDALHALGAIGITYGDAVTLRRASRQLQTWNEHECNGAIQRDESTGLPYWYSTITGKRLCRTSDREAGATRRIHAVMKRYPSLSVYIQGDPRGAALYVLQPGDVPAGADPGAYYSRGIAVY